MRQLIFAIFIVLILPIQLIAQSTSFQFNVDGPTASDISQGIKLAVTSDNGYLIAGGQNASASGFGSWMPKLTKTDFAGNIMFSTRINVTGLIWDALQNTAGNYVAVGTVSSGPTTGNIFLVEVNSCGTVQWIKEYGNTFTNEARGLIQTNDGGYLICGASQTTTATSSRRALLLKTDGSGNQQWAQLYASGESFAMDVIQTADGGYIFSGYYRSGFLFTYVVKTNNLGGVTWGNSYQLNAEGGSFDQGQGASIRQTPAGEYIIFTKGVGNSGRRAGILKLNATGGPLWNKVYSVNGDINFGSNQSTGYGGLIESSGNLTLLGITSFRLNSLSTPELMVIHCNSSGTPLWGKAYSVPGSEMSSGAGAFASSHVSEIHKTGDNGYAFCGLTRQLSSNTRDLYLSKVYSNGDAECQENSFTVGEFSSTATSLPMTANPANTISQATSSLTSAASFPFITSTWTNVCSSAVNPSNPIDTIASSGIIGPTDICPTPFTGTYSVINPGSGYTFNWSVTGGTINSGQGTNSVQVTWNTNGPNTISITYNGPCSYTKTISLQVSCQSVACPPIEIIAGSNAAIQPITLCPTTFTPVSGITFGPTTNQVRTPFATALYGHRIQYLYRNCELQAGGTTGPVTISQFGFHVTSVNSTPMTGFTIKMKNVSTDVNWQPLQGATSPWLSFGGGDFVGGATVVYSQNYTVSATGWNMFTLTTPFVWDGVSSVLVEVCWENATPGTGSSGVTYSQTQFTQSVATSSYTASTTTFTGAPGCNVPDVGNFNVVNIHTNRPIAKFVLSNANITPAFNPIAPICAGATFTLPTTSTNGVTGTWSPAINNNATTTYTFTPTTGQCATTTTLTVTVNSSTTPTFNPIAPICSGGTFTLPTTSTNGITGTWSPAVNNTVTTTYTFTPAAGQCATTTTLTVNVGPPATPTFNPIAPICSGGTFTLPTTSTNGITGTWSPAVNNTVTTTYTFTPAAGQCATTTTLTVTVNSSTTPTFNPITPICAGGTFTLPTTSTNSINGTWSPAVNNTATTTYTFTPTAGQCATTTTLTVTVNPAATPTFNPIAPICTGGTFTLPTTSTNGITGSWSPAINNTTTTTYTFTPTTGQCTTTTTLTVTVNSSTTPTFNPIAPICAGGTFTLPTTSTNGITGTWSPAINNNATTTYTFTPAAGACATTATLTVSVGPPAAPTFNPIAPICAGATFTLPTTSTNGVTGTWSPAINNNATTTYTFTPTTGQCATTTTLTVTVNSSTTPTFNPIAPICAGATFTLPTTSTNGVTGTWSPAINNNATTTYTFTPTTGQCATTTTLTVTVNSSTTPTFNPIAPICTGGTFTLPTTSTNGITGTWSPAINNNATTTYTFTPTAGACVTTATLTVTVNPSTTPTFNPIAPICAGGTFTLPTTSTNGITGSWSPAINNTTTTTYTFTPTTGQCATIASMTVVVNQITAPVIGNISQPSCFNLTGSVVLDGLPSSGNWTITINPGAVTSVGNGTTTTIQNLAPGNYNFTVTSNGCTSFASNIAVIEIYNNLNLSAQITAAYCDNADGSINVSASGGQTPISYNWSNGASGPTLQNIMFGNYVVTATDALGCQVSESYFVGYYNDTTFLNVSPSLTQITIGGSVNLLANGAQNYLWVPATQLSCSTCANPIATPINTTTYMVIGENNSGCLDTAYVTIVVNEICGESFLPNVFSPNDFGPEENNVLCVLGNCIEQLSLEIYNQWGELVFQTNERETCWDGTFRGKALNTGVFAYVLYIKETNGNIIEKTGTISLLR